MQMPWKAKGMRKWTLSEAIAVPFSDVNRMKTPERAELAYFLQSQLKRRVSSYNRAKSYNNPYAYQKLREDFEELNEVSGYNFDFFAPIVESKGRKHMLSDVYNALDNPNAKLSSYIVQLQDFFSSKSSTVSGWREIIRNESMKLFGYKEYKTKRGSRIVLNHMMTEKEREMFWKLYEEIRKSGRTIIYDSDAMRETGYTRIWREKLKAGEWDFDDLTGMMNDMLAALKANGQIVRDFEEHKPGNSRDPIQLDQDENADSEVFVW